MNKENKQQRLLALILFLVVLAASWFLFLQPSLRENRNLKTDLSNRESVTSTSLAWQDSARREAQVLNIEVVSEEGRQWVIRGSLPQAISLLALVEDESGLSFTLDKKGKNFLLSW